VHVVYRANTLVTPSPPHAVLGSTLLHPPPPPSPLPFMTMSQLLLLQQRFSIAMCRLPMPLLQMLIQILMQMLMQMPM